MFIVAFISGMMGWSDTQPARANPYAYAVRCAGVAQAASELEGGESRYGRALSDTALYWSLVAMQSAQANGRTPEQGDADQNNARLNAVRLLTANNKATRTQLQRCRQQTPRMG